MKSLAAFLLIAAAATLATPLGAQIAPPDPGILFSYHYAPEQFVQFVGPELPYSMISVEVTPGKKPVVAVILTARATGARTLYSDDAAVVAAARAEHIDAHQTALAWDEADAQTTGAVSTLRMSLADGKPLEWRFVQGSDVSEQGAGLTDLHAAPILILAYREEAAVAGEGTALRIGTVTSAADVWSEISRPPYFIAYHGALSLGAHRLVLPPSQESYTVISPAALTPGAAWQLSSASGDRRSLTLTAADGSDYTMDLVDTAYPSTHTTVHATRTGDTWQVNSLRFAPVKDGDKHFLTATLTPGSLEIAAGKKTRIASGTLAPTPAGGRTLTMQTPAWARGKSLVEQSSTTPTTETDTAHP